jgi:hypothetical protein
VAVGVAVGVFVGVDVGVRVGVCVGVFVGVSVGVAVGVAVGVLVGVAVGVWVGVDVGVDVCVGVDVGVCVGVAVGVLLGVDVGVRVGVAVGLCDGVAVGDDVGVLVLVGDGVLVPSPRIDRAPNVVSTPPVAYVREIVVEPAAAGLVLEAPNGSVAPAPTLTVYCSVWPAPGVVGGEVPAAVANSTTRSPRLVLGERETNVPEVPVNVTKGPPGVLWLTSKNEIAPAATAADAVSVTTTLAMTAGGLTRMNPTTREPSIPVGPVPPSKVSLIDMPLNFAVLATSGESTPRVWTMTRSRRSFPLPTVWENVNVVVPALDPVLAESTMGIAAARPASTTRTAAPAAADNPLVIAARIARLAHDTTGGSRSRSVPDGPARCHGGFANTICRARCAC